MKNPSIDDGAASNKAAAVVRLVATTLGLPEEAVGLDASMDNMPAWDSAEHMSICLAFERQFGVRLSIDDITSATSITALAALVP